MKIKDIPILNFSELNRELYDTLEIKHRECIQLIVSCGTEYYYKKLINETLWNYDLKILEDLIAFFELQNMFEFCFLIEKGIEIKMLQQANKILGLCG